MVGDAARVQPKESAERAIHLIRRHGSGPSRSFFPACRFAMHCHGLLQVRIVSALEQALGMCFSLCC